MATDKKLVIVESPAKARTLGKILGKSYSIKASVGHIRDLPQKALGVDVKNDFAPRYVVPKTKKAVVKELKEAASKASEVFLATDPDREGEAISWHLVQAVKLDQGVTHRVVFHEITEQAIKEAFKHPRQINMDLVDAQQARRTLDRLVGYKLSPLLWRKVRGRLSAGRVQSVALRMIVEREREILNFMPQEYWSIEVDLKKGQDKKAAKFRAKLASLRDGGKLKLDNQDGVTPIVEDLKKAEYSVLKVVKKKVTRQPSPPFITSTLQQEAWRKLHFTAERTMRVAQDLYEGLSVGDEGQVGLITYMRTDSTRVAESAIQETREFIAEKFGSEFVPAKPRVFTKKAAGAQEAHEAIRPTRVQREPGAIRQYLTNDQAKLYKLIWDRMVASQMANGQFETTTADIEGAIPSKAYLLKATGTVPVFLGFLTLYSEGRDEEGEEEGKKLPPLAAGDKLSFEDIFPEQHFTQPPPRYNEATLVKALEEKGIGRPSTYAPILSTLRKRSYVERKSGRFQPLELGFTVSDLLVEHFPKVIDVDFTAKLEEELDQVAGGRQDWVGTVREFYTPFEEALREASEKMVKVKPPDRPTDEVCPECNKPMVIRTGRFGDFLACTGFPKCKTTRSLKTKEEEKDKKEEETKVKAP